MFWVIEVEVFSVKFYQWQKLNHRDLAGSAEEEKVEVFSMKRYQ